MLQKIRKKTSLRNKKGAAIVEYGVLVGGVLLVALAAIALFGHKTTDLMAATAATLPCVHADDNGPIVSGKIIETTKNDEGAIILDFANIAEGGARLSENLGDEEGALASLVLEAGHSDEEPTP